MIEPRLYLITPPVDDLDAFRPALEEACAAGEVAAVLLRLAHCDERTLVTRVKALAPIAQALGAAVIVADPGGETDVAAVAIRGGADGAQAYRPERVQDLCRGRKGGFHVGAGGLLTRHDAMVAGEAGVDYVMFGEPGRDGRRMPLDLLEERAEWWADIFQTPCVVVAPNLASIPDLASTGADFVALYDAVWGHPDGPGAAVKEVLAALRPVREPAA